MPTRSMVGQLPLEQHIGVRIPGGQPILHIQSQPSLTYLDVSLSISTHIDHYKSIIYSILLVPEWPISVKTLLLSFMPEMGYRHLHDL